MVIVHKLGMASTRLEAFARNLYSLIGSAAIVCDREIICHLYVAC